MVFTTTVDQGETITSESPLFYDDTDNADYELTTDLQLILQYAIQYLFLSMKLPLILIMKGKFKYSHIPKCSKVFTLCSIHL